MSTARSIDELQGDLRCGLCKQKGIFLCEHDTPYRDLYLGIYDPYLPRNIAINTEKSKPTAGTQNTSTNNGGLNKKTGGQPEQTKQTKKIVANTKATTEAPPEKEKKGCTIL